MSVGPSVASRMLEQDDVLSNMLPNFGHTSSAVKVLMWNVSLHPPACSCEWFFSVVLLYYYITIMLFYCCYYITILNFYCYNYYYYYLRVVTRQKSRPQFPSSIILLRSKSYSALRAATQNTCESRRSHDAFRASRVGLGVGAPALGGD